jgi:hypothetical protein
MIAAYFVAVLLFVILFFVFLHQSPKCRKGGPAYNIGVFVVTAVLSARHIRNLHGKMEGSADEQWFYVIVPLTHSESPSSWSSGACCATMSSFAGKTGK